MKQERIRNGRCNRVARLEKPDGLSEARDFSHEFFTETDSFFWHNIPKHWDFADIKYVFEIVKRIAGKEGYDVLSVTQKGLKVKDITCNEGQIAANYKGYQFVYPDDFVMNPYGFTDWLG